MLATALGIGKSGWWRAGLLVETAAGKNGTPTSYGVHAYVCVVRVCGDGGLSGAARRSVTVLSWRRRATPDKTKTSVAPPTLLPCWA